RSGNELVEIVVGPGAALPLHGRREIETPAVLAPLVPHDPVKVRTDAIGAALSKVWQAPHFFAAAAPFSTEAVCNSVSMGSEAAGAASFAPPCASSFTAISKPGFAGICGAKSAPAVKLVTSRTRQVPRIAPRILLSSKESIGDQAPGRKC